MRFEPPLQASPWRGGSGDLDRLLSEFFRSELPPRWTAPEIADEQPALPLPAPRSRRATWRSRFALAASVALILGGFGLLGGKFKDISAPRTTAGVSNGQATRPRIRSEAIEVDRSGQSKLRLELDLP